MSSPFPDDASGTPGSVSGATPDLVVVGSYNLDIGIRLARFPSPGETLFASGLTRGHGGKGSNQAVQAARHGARVAMLAAIGDDPAGEDAIRLWSGESIDTSGVAVRKGLPTGTAFISVDAGGENQIVVVSGANASLTAADVDAARDLIGGARVVLAQLEVPPEAIIASFRIGRAAGATTMLNAAPAIADLPPALLALTDFLIVNESEAEQIGANLQGKVALGVVTTLGARGARLASSDGAAIDLAAPSVRVVDTTGAGDAFVGAFAACWIRSADALQATRAGIAAGSKACGTPGALAARG